MLHTTHHAGRLATATPVRLLLSAD